MTQRSMAGMRPLRSAVSRNSCDSSTPNSCVGRRISTSTMSGCPWSTRRRAARRWAAGAARIHPRAARSRSAPADAARGSSASMSQARPSSGRSPIETQRRDDRGVGSRARPAALRAPAFARQLVDGLGQHRQHRREFQHALARSSSRVVEPRERDEQHAAELSALEQCKGTTCAGGICALPPQAAALPAHVMRIFDYLLDQRVVLREQEVATRPERMPCAVVDRQGENFGLPAHEATRQRREQRSWSFMVGRVLCHRWPQSRGARKQHRRRSVATWGSGDSRAPRRVRSNAGMGHSVQHRSQESPLPKVGVSHTSVSVKRFLQLPALVRPRPVGGCGANLFLDHARVTRGEFAARQLLARRGERHELHLVVAARNALDAARKTPRNAWRARFPRGRGKTRYRDSGISPSVCARSTPVPGRPAWRWRAACRAA